MKQIKFNYFPIVLAFLIVFQSCHKEKIAPVHVTPGNTGLSVKLTTGLYVLNQGSTTAAGSLTFYDFNSKKVYRDLFDTVNNAHIGTYGSDMGFYGSKLYCMTDSGLIALNAHTGKLIEKGNIVNGESLAFYKNDVIYGWSNVLSETDTAKISANDFVNFPGLFSDPASMYVLNNKLYLANEDIRGSSVLVIDPSSFNAIKSLVVGGFAYSCTADAFGNLYVLQNFASIQQGILLGGGITIIDDMSDTVKTTLHGKQNIGQIYAQGNFVYYPTADGEIAMYNSKTQTAVRDNFITDGTLLISPRAIAGNSITGEIFITDVKDRASNGMLYAFDNTGKLENSFNTGVNPVRIVLLN